jgi:hypothetical protein
MASVDHRKEQDERANKLIVLACPACGTEVLVLPLPAPSFIWCAQCSTTPRLERVP